MNLLICFALLALLILNFVLVDTTFKKLHAEIEAMKPVEE